MDKLKNLHPLYWSINKPSRSEFPEHLHQGLKQYFLYQAEEMVDVDFCRHLARGLQDGSWQCFYPTEICVGQSEKQLREIGRAHFQKQNSKTVE